MLRATAMAEGGGGSPLLTNFNIYTTYLLFRSGYISPSSFECSYLDVVLLLSVIYSPPVGAFFKPAATLTSRHDFFFASALSFRYQDHN